MYRRWSMLLHHAPWLALLLAGPAAHAETHPFGVHDMWAMKRISDPHVSPDGKWVLFTLRTNDLEANRGRTDLWIVGSDGGAPRQLTSHPAGDSGGRWSADGAWLVYRTDDLAAGSGDVLALNLRDSSTVTVAATQFEETGPELSPDGRWIAYASNRSGRKEVYVRPFPAADGGLWQVSVNGGSEPRWSRDGRG